LARPTTVLAVGSDNRQVPPDDPTPITRSRILTTGCKCSLQIRRCTVGRITRKHLLVGRHAAALRRAEGVPHPYPPIGTGTRMPWRSANASPSCARNLCEPEMLTAGFRSTLLRRPNPARRVRAAAHGTPPGCANREVVRYLVDAWEPALQWRTRRTGSSRFGTRRCRVPTLRGNGDRAPCPRISGSAHAGRNGRRAPAARGGGVLDLASRPAPGRSQSGSAEVNDAV
jgi:hypothetical protein